MEKEKEEEKEEAEMSQRRERRDRTGEKTSIRLEETKGGGGGGGGRILSCRLKRRGIGLDRVRIQTRHDIG